ncbi:YidB family protein [Teredinibacter haidensis]|uniref:YidB family protein n=1 Tax=Teredinibacter haidensis TaxID=2731755 RepID=UPI000948A581|nr:YidB family protein [Teredinibacter haidensis]
MQNLLEIAAKLFMEKVGSGVNLTSVISALKGLLPTDGDNLDIGALISKLSGGGGGIGQLVQSWLGDGENASFSPSDVMQVFGEDKIATFSDKLGLDQGQAASGLASMIPDLVDKSSEGGSLVQGIAASVGGKLLGGLFK